MTRAQTGNVMVCNYYVRWYGVRVLYVRSAGMFSTVGSGGGGGGGYELSH